MSLAVPAARAGAGAETDSDATKEPFGVSRVILENPGLDQLFADAKITGTFVLYEVTSQSLVMHNRNRAEKRFIPASTFKIANSLIGLATGAVADVEELVPYGGEPQYLKIWEQDMGLRDAIRVSNVPVYQELARRIGLERMRANLAMIPYGNATTGDVVDMFWLRGPLMISALEQTEFLARLAQGELPFTAEIQTSVREILKIEQDSHRTLYGKTGWASAPDPQIGWWVGWVVRDGQIFSFALNIDMPENADPAIRVTLGKACLALLGVL